jgi:hypothetical protein
MKKTIIKMKRMNIGYIKPNVEELKLNKSQDFCEVYRNMYNEKEL